MAVQKVRLLGDFRPHIDYALVMRDTTCSPFVACWAPKFGEAHPDGTVDCVWGQGHYFNDILSATKYIQDMLDEEIDTGDFLDDGWVDDDVEDLMDMDLEDIRDALLNMPCDTHGMCAGTSCKLFYECHGGN